MRKILYLIFIVLYSCSTYNTKTTHFNPSNDIILKNSVGAFDSISTVFYEEIINVKGVSFANYSGTCVRTKGILLLDISTIRKCDDIEKCYQKGIFTYPPPYQYSDSLKKRGESISKVYFDIYDVLDSIPVSKSSTFNKMPYKFYDQKYPVLFGYNIRKLTIKYLYGGISKIWIPDCSSEREKMMKLIDVPTYYIYDIRTDTTFR